MKVYVDNKDKMTSYQWGYDEESKRYFVKINFDVSSDTKVKVLSLSDYTKQVRKEVLNSLITNLIDHFTAGDDFIGDICWLTADDVIKWLKDQIQGDQDGTGNNQ